MILLHIDFAVARELDVAGGDHPSSCHVPPLQLQHLYSQIPVRIVLTSELLPQFPPSESKLPNFNPFKPEFTIVIFIHYKPGIAVAILDLQWMKMV